MVLQILYIILIALCIGIPVISWIAARYGFTYAPFLWLFGHELIVPVLGVIITIVAVILFYKMSFASQKAWLTLAVGIFALAPTFWQIAVGPIRYPADKNTMRPSVTIRWPMAVSARVAWGGDEVSKNYHAFVPDQRWAYDIVREPALHGAKSLEKYGCYGLQILAPADGIVTHTHDGAPDLEPGPPSMPDEPLGNFVAIKLNETGTYILIAHMKNGSVAVKVGQQIKAGDLIGACGNSGNTSEPHIHIHHQRQPPDERPMNFAEGLPLYFKSEQGPIMPQGGISKNGKLTGDIVAPYD